MEDGNPLWGIVIVLILVLLNAIVSSAKTAFDAVNESSIRKKAEEGDKRAITYLKILEKSGSYIYVLELLLGFASISIGIVYASLLLHRIDGLIEKNGLGLEPKIFIPLCYIVITFILVFFVTLFGMTLPRKFTIKHSEVAFYRIAGLILFFIIILKPITWLFEKLLYLILRLLGIKPHELTESITEEEVISMVNEGHEQGIFDAGEVKMISNIMELDDKEAQDIMTPKKKIVAVNSEMNIEEAMKFMLSGNYSRYPLYEDNRDNIIGILYLKDVISVYIKDGLKEMQLSEIAREPYFIPDTQNINVLFRDMQSKNIHMAIAIDEYGQTAGVVAMEDILEEIVGNIQDEYDVEEKMVFSKEKDSVLVHGSISLEDLEEECSIILENDDFDTLNGLLISLLDRIPGDGERETLEYAGYQFDILETMNKMIERVRITRLPEVEEELEAAENSV